MQCRFYDEVELKWDSFTPKGLALLLLGLAELVPTAPLESVQRGLVKAIKLKFKKPAASGELQAMVLDAAGVPADAAVFDQRLWCSAFFRELAGKWGLARSVPPSRLGSLPAGAGAALLGPAAADAWVDDYEFEEEQQPALD